MLLAAFALFLLAGLASAQDDPPREVRGVSGPYDLRVATINENPSAGFVQYSVFIHETGTGEAVSDARVVILAHKEGAKEEGWANALNSPAFPDRYDSRVNLDSTGNWAITVEVESPLGFGGMEVGTVTVPTLQQFSSGSLVFFGAFGAIILGLIYVIWSTKRSNRKRQQVQG